ADEYGGGSLAERSRLTGKDVCADDNRAVGNRGGSAVIAGGSGDRDRPAASLREKGGASWRHNAVGRAAKLAGERRRGAGLNHNPLADQAENRTGAGDSAQILAIAPGIIPGGAGGD